MAKYDEIFDKVCELIVNQLPVKRENITPDSNLLDDLNADSANIMMLIMDLETEYEIEVSDDMLTEVHTVGDIVNYLVEHT